MEMLLMLVVLVPAMYFLMIRPQQKRMREHQSQIDALQPGDLVVLTSGIFATLSHVADKQAVAELAPGVEVTILKQAIMRVASEDEEEFEFTDEVDEAEEVTEGEEKAADGIDTPEADVAETQESTTIEESVSEKN